MPVTEREWNEEQFDTDEDTPGTDPVGEYETDKDLIIAFLGENADKAYTRAEIHRGVDFGETDDPDTIHEQLSLLPNRILDAAGDVAASDLVSDNLDEALAELVEEDTVTRKELERDGETTTYYRLTQT
ncbi:hypothetical protein [Halococcus agarilyticus]|uniref:hypothetical protein n=1 Tax=Halococcus agarilyticus TaxID=1232219 RepID=UPI000677D574|nr:hypothetical protein [Halococcus agarilyticus]